MLIRIHHLGCDSTARSTDIEAEADVRGSAHPAPAADLEYGAGGDDNGEPEEYGDYCSYGFELPLMLLKMATVDAMKVANKEMKKQYKGIDIDKIEVS